MTIEKNESINMNEKRFDQNIPSFEEYLASALENLNNTSRTASGTIDTSASITKSAQMNEGLNSENAAERAIENFKEATRQAYANKDKTFSSAVEVRQFVENIAQIVNKRITKEGILIRSGADSPKYPYTRLENLDDKMSQFYEDLYERLNNPQEDPKELAAFVEFKIDLSDHFFADGCGKTAKVISSWIMMRAGKKLPDYTEHGLIPASEARMNYYRNAPKIIPGTDLKAEAEELESWINHYKKYF